MNPVLRELFDSARRDPVGLGAALKQREEALTRELADEARLRMGQAAESQNLGLAMAAAMIAATAYSRTGAEREFLTTLIDLRRFQFLQADTLEDYLKLKDEFGEAAVRAQKSGADDLEFRALVSMADCLYFAREAAGQLETGNVLLIETLWHLAAASSRAAGRAGDPFFDVFVSLLGAACDQAESTLWSDLDEAKLKALLPGVARAVETVVPLDYEFPGDRAKAGLIARVLGRLSYRYGAAAAATARLQAAMQRAEVTGDLEEWLQLARDRYQGERDAVGAPPALEALRHDIAQTAEAFRVRFRSRAGRLWAAQAIDRSISEAVVDAINLGATDDAELFAAVDALKARVLLDQMSGKETFLAGADGGEAAEMERRVLRFAPEKEWDLEQAEMKLLSRLSIGGWGEGPERRTTLDTVEALYERRFAGFRAAGPVPALADVVAALAPDEALIEYFIPSHPTHPAKQLFILGITAKDVAVVPVSLGELPMSAGVIGTVVIDGRQPLDVSPLGELVWSLRVAIRRGEDATARLRLEQLWTLLIFPLLRWNYPDEFKRWIIVPHGPLHYVPFAALAEPGGGVFLVEDVALTVCPSAAVWLALRNGKRQPLRSFLGVADPLIRDQALAPLKDTLKELSNAIKSLPALAHTSLPADRATESLVCEEIGGKSIVHFAAHGEFPEEDPFDFHQIRLVPTKDHDGRLRAEELRRMDLSAARLVVLSICDGGLYRFGPGDEPYGLIPALLAAGAQNVLAPLWPIEDTAARRLTSLFYKGLLKHGPAEALRRACKESIKKKRPFREWAGFVAVGPGRPLQS